MWDNFDNDDFDEDDMDDFRRKKDETQNHPLKLKSIEIFRLTKAIVGSLDEARKELYGTLMLESAMLLSSKFAGAHPVDDFIIKMENAVIMKVHAKSLYSMSYQLAMEGTHAEDHLQLLRDAIDEFRELFKEWIKNFDQAEKSDDGWGLFID
ncbi:hypothetical protein ACFOUP_14035 [Belliella kenyensis]|uniref:Uncharacterized protein n=1 Tax=Belliella kenyensis TaxID=1472724 RepID=A0ABV8EP79_9BACT|nr:hypothetical protein [Belliella kenyensis]MCH7401563.1 hypothetical protein [Belliella kenyensis]MDN3603157.1 hypothetical protein [Belliella kenyensis]